VLLTIYCLLLTALLHRKTGKISRTLPARFFSCLVRLSTELVVYR